MLHVSLTWDSRLINIAHICAASKQSGLQGKQTHLGRARRHADIRTTMSVCGDIVMDEMAVAGNVTRLALKTAMKRQGNRAHPLILAEASGGRTHR
jgi:hypothetical protein